MNNIPEHIILFAVRKSLELQDNTVPEWLYWNWLSLGKDLQKKIEAIAVNPVGVHWERLAGLWYVESVKVIKRKTPRFQKYPKGVKVV